MNAHERSWKEADKLLHRLYREALVEKELSRWLLLYGKIGKEE
jgi:hypothetical protein